jgi:hypothetical protein
MRYKRTIYVTLSCNRERMDESEVEFLDIEEDNMGSDVLYFKCPVCKKQHTSLRFS